MQRKHIFLLINDQCQIMYTENMIYDKKVIKYGINRYQDVYKYI